MSRKSPSLSSDSSESTSSECPCTPTSPSRQLLSRLFPSRYNSVNESPLPPNRRRFLELDHITDDPTVDGTLQTAEDTYKSQGGISPRVITTTASPSDTPKPDHFIPHGAVTEWTTSPIEDVASATYQDRSFASTSLSISMDMLPTPYGSRNGSVYEPSLSLPKSITRDSDHLIREPRVESITVTLEPGSIICSNETGSDQISLSLVRTLGQGSFSSVWLGRDDSGSLEKLVVSRKASIKRQKINGEGIVRRKSSKRLRSRMEGTKPWQTKPVNNRTDQYLRGNGDAEPEPVHETVLGGGRLVAVKLTERALSEVNDRTRVSFIREVEVLRVCVSFLTPRSTSLSFAASQPSIHRIFCPLIYDPYASLSCTGTH